MRDGKTERKERQRRKVISVCVWGGSGGYSMSEAINEGEQKQKVWGNSEERDRKNKKKEIGLSIGGMQIQKT